MRNGDGVRRSTGTDGAGCEGRAESEDPRAPKGKTSRHHAVSHPRDSESYSAPGSNHSSHLFLKIS